jgi:hypothetical protein
MVPVISALIGSAFWGGLLATVGALVGMSLSDGLLARFETGASGIAPMAAPEKTRPPV